MLIRRQSSIENVDAFRALDAAGVRNVGTRRRESTTMEITRVKRPDHLLVAIPCP